MLGVKIEDYGFVVKEVPTHEQYNGVIFNKILMRLDKFLADVLGPIQTPFLPESPLGNLPEPKQQFPHVW